MNIVWYKLRRIFWSHDFKAFFFWSSVWIRIQRNKWIKQEKFPNITLTNQNRYFVHIPRNCKQQQNDWYLKILSFPVTVFTSGDLPWCRPMFRIRLKVARTQNIKINSLIENSTLCILIAHDCWMPGCGFAMKCGESAKRVKGCFSIFFSS